MVMTRLLMLSAALLISCANERQKAPGPGSPDPLLTVETLLELHNLRGKQPEERSVEILRKQVAREDLEKLIVDFKKHDPFIGNLYVGFVVGALSRYQTRLHLTVKGKRAAVRAGKVQVVMRLVGDVWLVVLEDSVPFEIKARAREEKLRLLAAKNVR